jgi:hypothetical protein
VSSSKNFFAESRGILRREFFFALGKEILHREFLSLPRIFFDSRQRAIRLEPKGRLSPKILTLGEGSVSGCECRFIVFYWLHRDILLDKLLSK